MADSDVRRRGRRLPVLVISAAVVMLASTVPASRPPVAHPLPGGWRAGGVWQGTSSGVTSLSLADVASEIDASGVGLDGTGVGVALIDTGVAPVPGLPAP